jgi:hypothetical protein
MDLPLVAHRVGSKMLGQAVSLVVKEPLEEACHLLPQRVPQTIAPGAAGWLPIGERSLDTSQRWLRLQRRFHPPTG